MRLYIKLFYLVLILCTFLWLSCSTKSVYRQYFILDYRPVLQDSSLKVEEPLPYKVQVRTMKIPRTFDRVGIVVRYSTHQLDYYRYQLWAIRPQIIVSDLIARHISNYNVFQSCQREFLEERPDFEIIGVIDAIEKFDNKAYTAAHLAMKLYLRTYDSYENILSHEFDREEEMPVFRMELFAKKLSDILREEVDVFIGEIIAHFHVQNESETMESR
ncbi:membrane integrity-associated transporter subunit PqiC [candidate division KSB1 bacterium]|nr:membrane integrity-associated transporter subunit PqiC [candidate division KSB1 bacterium]MBL7094071.1 membrane integrity-associated transporter subunit PqiC [candidate division KSB1 bacterium]